MGTQIFNCELGIVLSHTYIMYMYGSFNKTHLYRAGSVIPFKPSHVVERLYRNTLCDHPGCRTSMGGWCICYLSLCKQPAQLLRVGADTK